MTKFHDLLIHVMTRDNGNINSKNLGDCHSSKKYDTNFYGIMMNVINFLLGLHTNLSIMTKSIKQGFPSDGIIQVTGT